MGKNIEMKDKIRKKIKENERYGKKLSLHVLY